jgi:hypothetical protein
MTNYVQLGPITTNYDQLRPITTSYDQLRPIMTNYNQLQYNQLQPIMTFMAFMAFWSLTMTFWSLTTFIYDIYVVVQWNNSKKMSTSRLRKNTCLFGIPKQDISCKPCSHEQTTALQKFNLTS